MIQRLIDRLIGPLRSRVTEHLARLSPRERNLLFAGAGVTVLLILWLGIYEPLASSIDQLDTQIAQARRDAAEVAALTERHGGLQSEVVKLESGSGGGEGGSLFAQLESITVPIVGRERIVSMNPATRQVSDRVEEETVDMRLEGVPLRDLLELLYAIEYRDPPLQLARAAFKREYKNPELIDTTLVVARLSPR